jgi:hypothetical protein
LGIAGSGEEHWHYVVVEAPMSVHITSIFVCMRAKSRMPGCKLWEICQKRSFTMCCIKSGVLQLWYKLNKWLWRIWKKPTIVLSLEDSVLLK